MKLQSLIVVLLGLVVLTTTDPATESQGLADANTEFALKFYKMLAGNEDPKVDNIIFSPFSISTALTMASRGAAGDTLTAMYDALQLKSAGLDETAVLYQSLKLLQVLTANTNQYNTSIANKLYGEQSFTFKPDFIEALEDSFLTTLETVDFKTQPEPSRELINEWVEEVTKDLIKDLLPRGSVTSQTILYIVNAIYFAAKWQNEFDERSNMDNEDFRVSNTETEQVTYMTRNGKRHNYGYAELEDLDAKLAELPYTDQNIAMYVLLPDDVQGLAALESKLTAEHLKNGEQSIFSKLTTDVKLNVRLPKFEMELPIQPKEILADMGMAVAFTDAADLTRIADANLAISDVVHQAAIKVHELGTEAGAATAIGIVATSFDPTVPQEFFADHPFIYMIREKTTGSILFMGRYKSPPPADGKLARVGEVNYQVTDGATQPGVFGAVLLSVISFVLAYISL